MLKKGTQAPEFDLEDQDGKRHTLKSLLAKGPLILYFYPADFTPGCTKEACSFRDGYGAYKKAGVEILGVSPDSPASHAKFKEKYSLPFTLLADEGHKVCDIYGVWGPKKFAGKSYEGVLRTTFLINPEGKIIKVFENVKPDGHSDEILAAIK